MFIIYLIVLYNYSILNVKKPKHIFDLIKAQLLRTIPASVTDGKGSCNCSKYILFYFVLTNK